MREAETMTVLSRLQRVEEKVDKLVNLTGRLFELAENPLHSCDKSIRSLCALRDRLAESLRDTYLGPASGTSELLESVLLIAQHLGIDITKTVGDTPGGRASPGDHR